MSGVGPGWMNRIGTGFNNFLMRSGLLMIMIVALLLAASYGLWYAHRQGEFHRIRVIEAVADKPTGGQPGGMETVRLIRSSVVSTVNPEFLSATFAPGLGMQILGATINLPDRGETTILQGSGNDGRGTPTDKSRGFSILETVAGRDGTHWAEPYHALAGQPDHVSYNAMPDGGETSATFAGNTTDIPAADAGVETRVSLTLGNHALDLLVSAKNNAAEPRSVVLRWEPRFLVSSGVALIPPRVDSASGPSTPPVITLGTKDIKAVYRGLRRSYLSNGPEVMLRNNGAGYVLHVIGVSATVQSLRVETQKGEDTVLLAFSTAAGEAGEDGTVIKPGETLQFHVRVEVTAVASAYR